MVAWRRLEDVSPQSLPWLLAVARNVLGTHIRSARRSRALSVRLAMNRIDQTAPSASNGGEVVAALATLKLKDREALMLVNGHRAQRRLLPAHQRRAAGLLRADRHQLLLVQQHSAWQRRPSRWLAAAMRRPTSPRRALINNSPTARACPGHGPRARTWASSRDRTHVQYWSDDQRRTGGGPVLAAVEEGLLGEATLSGLRQLVPRNGESLEARDATLRTSAIAH